MNKLIVTIFGATGDLTIRKLLPALENILKTQKDYKSISIVAVGRREYTSEEYLNFVTSSNAYSGDINALRPYLIYAKVDVNKSEDYVALSTLYPAISRSFANVRHIYYLAVGPDLFMPIADNLSQHKLVTKGDKTRIIAFEKPFGHTFSDATFINEFLEEKFSQEQIYRVDHYLGKEMIQNIIGIRFANEIISGLYNYKHLSEVKIVVSEKDGIMNRGAYYDEVGVLNDMIQSHLLQILALLIMKKPKSLESKDLQKVKIAALKRVKYVANESLLGQYRGYRQEKGVDPNSLISTLAFLTVKVDDPKLKDVPFYLFTGKKLARQEAYIELIFKTPRSASLFNGVTPNRLRIEIAPHARIKLELNSRDDLQNNNINKVVMDHCFNCTFPSAIKEAYEQLFLEMMKGNDSLFPSFKEIKASWEIINQIRKEKPRYIIYEPGFSLYGEENAL